MPTKRIGDFIEINDYRPLREIDGEEVVITGSRIESENVDGRTRYKSYITIENGDTFVCWSANIARTLQRVLPSDYPIRGKFTLETNAGRTYWTFE